MSKGKAPDPKRRRKTHAHASYLAVKCGQKEAGYKAGELYGCYTHRTFAAQPCVADITNGELKCAWCASQMISEWRGYVPVWDRDWTLRYVLIGEDYYESVNAIPLHAQIAISRAKNPISPLVVREELSMTRKLPDRPPWKEPVDMLEICLTLWQQDALTRWILSHREAPNAAEEVKQPEAAAEKKPRLKGAAAMKAYEEKEAKRLENMDARFVKIVDGIFKPAPGAEGPYKGPPK